MSGCRTFRYLLQPTTCQKAALDEVLRLQCELYNAALEERRTAWSRRGHRISYFDQTKELAGLREVRPELFSSGVTLCRGTLKRRDRAFQAFFRRVRSGETPGYPRFRSARRFDSVQCEDTSGWRVDEVSSRLFLMGIGHVKLRQHRPVRGQPKAITVKREGRRVFVSIRCVAVAAEKLPTTGREVGIDVGVVALVATSAGELIHDGRFFKHSQHALATRQRDLHRKTRGSNRRARAAEAVGRAHRHLANQRHDLAHQLSRHLVNNDELIAIEDLSVKNMVRRPRPRPDDKGGFQHNGATAKAGLNRSIYDAGWSQVRALLVYKAEDAGRELIAVNPRHTSTRCSACGQIDAESRRSQAVFVCQRCGFTENADVNAAKNILWAGRAQRAFAREGPK